MVTVTGCGFGGGGGAEGATAGVAVASFATGAGSAAGAAAAPGITSREVTGGTVVSPEFCAFVTAVRCFTGAEAALGRAGFGDGAGIGFSSATAGGGTTAAVCGLAIVVWSMILLTPFVSAAIF
ncbi:MAG TPA: hypothetical protein VGH37_00725 [Candidatus Acidoferrum sp.]